MEKPRKEINILFTSAGGKTPLLFAFKNAFRKLSYAGKVIAADISSYAVSRMFADSFFLVPRRDDSAYLSALKEIIARENINLIIPTSDEDVLYFSNIHNARVTLGAQVLAPSLYVAELSRDKAAFLKFCSDCHLATPRRYTIEEIETNQIPFPLFFNSRSGRGSSSACVVDTPEELKIRMQKISDPIITELIKAPEYTIDCFADFHGNLISIVPRKRIVVWGGESFVTATEKNKHLIECARVLCNKLRVSGPVNFQCFFNGKQAVFFEMNARFGGASRLAFEAGADTPELLIRLLQGEQVLPRVGDFRDKLYMLRFKDDVFCDEHDLLSLS